MKYIKKYENLYKKIYNKGDIVRVANNIEEFSQPYAKIKTRYKHRPSEYPTDKYYVEILFPNTSYWAYDQTDEYHNTTLEDYLIVRKLTKKELKELELKIATDKYNL